MIYIILVTIGIIVGVISANVQDNAHCDGSGVTIEVKKAAHQIGSGFFNLLVNLLIKLLVLPIG
jgi:hypothetical protein